MLLLAIHSLCAGQITYAVTRDILEDSMKRAVTKAFVKLEQINWIKLTKTSVEDGLEVMRLGVKPVLDMTQASIVGSGGDTFRLNIGTLLLNLDLDYVLNSNLRKNGKGVWKFIWKVLDKILKVERQGNAKAALRFRNVTLVARSFLVPHETQIGHQRFM